MRPLARTNIKRRRNMRQGHELIINNNDAFMVSLLEKNNPFGLTLNDGRSMFFYQPVEAYLCVMTTAYGLAPKGYIELPLLLMKFYRHLSYVNCKVLSKAVCRGNFLEEVIQLDSWQKMSTLNYFKRLCSGLCALVETPYNSGYVEQAWQLLLQRMEIERVVNEVKEVKE